MEDLDLACKGIADTTALDLVRRTFLASQFFVSLSNLRWSRPGFFTVNELSRTCNHL